MTFLGMVSELTLTKMPLLQRLLNHFLVQFTGIRPSPQFLKKYMKPSVQNGVVLTYLIPILIGTDDHAAV